MTDDLVHADWHTIVEFDTAIARLRAVTGWTDDQARRYTLTWAAHGNNPAQPSVMVNAMAALIGEGKMQREEVEGVAVQMKA